MHDFNVLLIDHYVRQGAHLYFRDAPNEINKELGLARDAQFRSGKNYAMGDHRDALIQVLDADGKAAKQLLGAMRDHLKLDKDTASTVLLAGHHSIPDAERVATALLDSPLLRGVERKGDTATAQLRSLSADNLARYDLYIDTLKARMTAGADAKGPSRAVETIGKVADEVARRYTEGSYAHASNRRIEGHILTANDRREIERYAMKVGNSQREEKTNHTAGTNVDQFASHDFVFLNVYPKTNPQHLSETLKATRYLRETPELPTSPYAADAQSFVYGHAHFFGREDGRLVVATMRDPVYPAGGKDADDKVLARVGQGIGKYVSHTQGEVRRTIGTLRDDYRTHENVFVGDDIPKALRKNVELGLYKAYVGLSEQRKANPSDTEVQTSIDTLTQTIKAATATADSPEKDRAIGQLVKMFQYPQLMVSGSVPTRDVDAQVFRVNDGLKQSVQPVAQPVQEAQLAHGEGQRRAALMH